MRSCRGDHVRDFDHPSWKDFLKLSVTKMIFQHTYMSISSAVSKQSSRDERKNKKRRNGSSKRMALLVSNSSVIAIQICLLGIVTSRRISFTRMWQVCRVNSNCKKLIFMRSSAPKMATFDSKVSTIKYKKSSLSIQSWRKIS